MTTPTIHADVLAATGDRLADPAVIRPSPDGRTRPQSVAGGAVGIALLHIERAVSGYGDEAIAHRWIRAAAGDPVSLGYADPFHGAPALAFMLHTARPLGGYHQARTALDNATITLTRQRLAAAHARIDRREPLPMNEFDLVHGLTGLALYHLHAHPEHPISAEVIDYLTRLTQPLGDGTNGMPPWWLTSGLGGTPDPAFPHGHGNLGAAHGISAVIAVLAHAILHGHDTTPARDALAGLCRWTDLHRQDEATGSWWPGYVTPGTHPEQPRPSWCYGQAGIARAQQLAGLAQNDTARQRLAENAILAVLRNPAQRGRLTGIGLCHGKAGLLQSACRMATTSTDPHRAARLAAELPALAAELTAQLPTDTNPEVMDGTAGAALALHTAASGSPATGWDAFLALS
jgi:lantibiotic biosynthesis protein